VPSAVPDSSVPRTPALLSGASFVWPGGRGVSEIDLAVQPGEIVTLLGPNGAGKSTILKMLSGELVPQQGQVSIFGEQHGPSARRRIGLVLQEPSTDDLMSLQETLQLHGGLFGLRGPVLDRHCLELLDSLGIGNRADDRCETLSGGLRRRLEIARALLHDPDLLLLDEPTLALDPDSSMAIWQTLHARASDGAAVMVCSNDTVEAEHNADRVMFVNRGRIIAEDTPSSLTTGLKSDALELDWPDLLDADLDELKRWNEVDDLLRTDSGLHLTVDNSAEIVPRLFQTYGSRVRGIRIHESSLRDAWFRIVGHPIENGIDHGIGPEA